MHQTTLDRWTHPHDFELHDRANERRVLLVVGLTLITMVIEIGAGMRFGSMALLADGWHMGTHAAALGITVVAYRLARKHAANPRFTFGTGKIGVLGGFTSAVVLAVVALMIAAESVQRLLTPQPIRFNEALLVAVIGLIVNLVSAWLLHRPGGSGQSKHHEHRHDHAHVSSKQHGSNPSHDPTHHQDHNLRGAYFHVLADALTSLLAIFALTAGKIWNWTWLDALIGIAGAIIITRWAAGLLRTTGMILLDRDIDPQKSARIRTIIEQDADNRIADLHLWKLGANQYAAIISLVTHHPRPPEHYKQLLAAVDGLAHITVEVNHCTSEPCIR